MTVLQKHRPATEKMAVPVGLCGEQWVSKWWWDWSLFPSIVWVAPEHAWQKKRGRAQMRSRDAVGERTNETFPTSTWKSMAATKHFEWFLVDPISLPICNSIAAMTVIELFLGVISAASHHYFSSLALVRQYCNHAVSLPLSRVQGAENERKGIARRSKARGGYSHSCGQILVKLTEFLHKI